MKMSLIAKKIRLQSTEFVVAFQDIALYGCIGLVQCVGASLTFCKNAFLNQIPEFFVRFDPKYLEQAHVSLLNAWENVARHLSLL